MGKDIGKKNYVSPSRVPNLFPINNEEKKRLENNRVEKEVNRESKVSDEKEKVELKSGEMDFETKINKWKKIRRLGSDGKDGQVWEVTDPVKGGAFAMKQFKPKKSAEKFAKELKMHQLSAAIGVAPLLLGAVRSPPFCLVMEKMENTLPKVLA